MNYRNADLNLLKVFEALMTEGNVTRAASKLSLTQPAVSNALRRLRDTFDDPLFVRSGAGVNPTRRAIDLWEPLSQSLHAIRATMDDERFDALRSTASVSIAMSDYVSSIVVPRLAARLGKVAPSMQVHAIPNTLVDFGPVLADNKADFAISVYNEEVRRPAFLKSRALWSPDFLCFMRAGHPLARTGKIPLKKFLAARHVDVSLVGKTTPTYDLFLRSRGLQRNLVATVNHYGAAYEAVRRSDLLAVLPWSEKFEPSRLAGLRMMPVPLEAPPRIIELFWHQRHETSALHQWVKDTLLALFEQPS
ncbi:LysR family transcriptional regulator [Variovorax sp. RKNM96]|jgi:DNA-binding transcriptional LysR family regulator|uniref:LysR family transcriptional regulator n=1 Tax=Variovorax sp. RKNM96 TaxID=2681552 RepID=UPI00197F6E93|nr:LysR family transcriptional regulator [Variovorax sp. RKNM96]QSI28135.1 LysR family transcriptional regulator [Variovorax sp. RKNM96]